MTNVNCVRWFSFFVILPYDKSLREILEVFSFIKLLSGYGYDISITAEWNQPPLVTSSIKTHLYTLISMI